MSNEKCLQLSVVNRRWLDERGLTEWIEAEQGS